MKVDFCIRLLSTRSLVFVTREQLFKTTAGGFLIFGEKERVFFIFANANAEKGPILVISLTLCFAADTI